MQGLFTELLKEKKFTITRQADNSVVVKDLKIGKVSIHLTSIAQKHLMESGDTRIDSRTIHPTEVMVEAFVPSVDTMTQLDQVFKDKDSLLKVNTRGLIFENMIIVGDVLSQTPQMLSATPVQIRFRQLKVDKDAPIIYENAEDSSLIDRGMAKLQDVKDKAMSTVEDLYNKASETAGQLIDRASSAI